MAESSFASVKRDPETGEFWVKEVGRSGYRPATPGEVEASFEGPLEGAGRNVVRALESTGRTLGQVAADVARPVNEMIPGFQYDEGVAEANRQRVYELQRQQAASSDDMLSFLAPFAPDVALAGATLGAGIPATAGRRAALGAFEGGVMGAGSDIDNPGQAALLGAALGGLGVPALEAGAGVAGSVLRSAPRQVPRGIARGVERGREVVNAARGIGRESVAADAAMWADEWASAVSRLRDEGRLAEPGPGQLAGARSIGAAATPDPNLYAGSARQLSGAADAAAMHEAGFPMTTTQARMLEETDGLGFQALRELDVEEEIASRTDPGLLTSMKNLMTGAEEQVPRGRLERMQQAWVNRHIAEEMGITGRSALTRQAVDKRMTEIGADIEDVIERTPGPIDMRGVADEWEDVLKNSWIEPGNPTLAQAASQFNDLMSRVKNNKGDVKALAQFRNRLSKRIDEAMQSPARFEVGEVLGEMRDILDKRFRRNWTPEMLEEYQQATRQWFVAKAAVKTRAATGARGDLNLPTFLGNYEGTGTGRKTALLMATNREFFEKLTAAAAVTAKEVGNTGSGQTAVQGIVRRLGNTALQQIPGGSLLGPL